MKIKGSIDKYKKERSSRGGSFVLLAFIMITSAKGYIPASFPARPGLTAHAYFVNTLKPKLVDRYNCLGESPLKWFFFFCYPQDEKIWKNAQDNHNINTYILKSLPEYFKKRSQWRKTIGGVLAFDRLTKEIILIFSNYLFLIGLFLKPKLLCLFLENEFKKRNAALRKRKCFFRPSF